MVINDFNVEGMSFTPSKADTPLSIDANAVLACTFATEGLEMVAGRNSQGFHLSDGFQHIKFPQGNAFDTVELSAFAGSLQELCVMTFVAFYHHQAPVSLIPYFAMR
jgi:hypothetical protein